MSTLSKEAILVRSALEARGLETPRIANPLTDAEKKLYKDTYIAYFNMKITSVSTEKNVENFSEKAANKAKKAVLDGRNK